MIMMNKDKEWCVKLIDFGVARHHITDVTYSPYYHTPGWTAPEQCGVSESTTCTTATDVWSWAVIAIQLLRSSQFGVLPPQFRDLQSLCNSRAHIDPSPWLTSSSTSSSSSSSLLSSDVLSGVIDLIRQCLCVKAAGRPSIATVVTHLESITG
jgi:serine/threonine protein kinase